MRRLRARALVIALVCAFGAGAEAQSPDAAMRMQVAGCTDDIAARLPSVVKLEIDVLLRERGPARIPPESIAVRCDAERARIEVTLGGATRASTIDLQALAAEHRARAVALAAAELVHAMAAQPRGQEPTPSPAAPPAMPRAAEADRSAVDSSGRRSLARPALLAGGFAEWRGNPAVLLLGGRIAVQYPLGRVVTPELSVDAAFGGIHSTSARVAVQSVATAAHVYFGGWTGSVRWEAGPGARFGWVRLAGQPDPGSALQGGTVNAAWGGPELRARVAYAASLLDPALIALEGAVGVVALPVRGLRDGTESVYAVEGAWLSIGVQAGLAF